ncbi:MAG: Ig-like domain repeat protein [Paludisphaera borealis]|uniref:Ig-like domain repeat protein n=1 Tax=Paludisphaera borealis TaxID=1387353 RepID=UPI002851F076|nr:Ig-like domain repeat protein [Paludisphaera borealis]MDR3620673.1 Ig-like domain repeat protein [Paludisphaera borealis]
MRTLRAAVGRTRLFQGNAAAKRRRWRPTAELLEDRLAPATGAWSALGAASPGLLNGQSTTDSYFRQTTLMTPGPAGGAMFGSSVSMTADGGTVAIGAPYLSSGQPGVEPGTVTLFTRTDRVWTSIATFSSPAGDHSFGDAVALSADGNTLAVGAQGGDVQHGAASLYIYTRSGTAWTLSQYVNMADGGGFGASLAISDDGSVIVAGAAYTNVGAHSAQGTVYVFTRADGVYTQGPAIVAADGATNDLFGKSIALSGDGSTLAVSAPAAQVVGLGVGAVYVYDHSGADWTFATRLEPAPSSTLSGPVAIDGDGSTLVIAGATTFINGGPVNSARVFTRSGADWTPSADLTASDPSVSKSFGASVAVSADGATAVVGASYSTSSQTQYPGAAYVFSLSGSTWTQTDKLSANTAGTALDYFGAVTAIRGRTIVVAAPSAAIGFHELQGSAYVFYSPQGFEVALDPVSQTGYVGMTTTFSSTVAGGTGVTVQWQVSTDAGATWTDIAGASNGWYSLVPALTDSGNQYRARFTDASSDTIFTHPATLTVVGTGTTTTLTSNLNPSRGGDAVTFTITVTDETGITHPPNGMVDLYIGGVWCLATSVDLYGQVWLTTTVLYPGTYTLLAKYRGWDQLQASESTALFQVVAPGVAMTRPTLTSSLTPSTVGDSVTFTVTMANLSGPTYPWAGDVDFYVGDQWVATRPVDADGQAKLTTSALVPGTYTLTAKYLGAHDFQPSETSEPFYQIVMHVKAPTMTTLTSNPNPSASHGSVTFTAKVTDASGATPVTTGGVDWYIGGVLVLSMGLDGTGAASFTTQSLVPGYYTLTAKYLGADFFQASPSAPYLQIVNATPAPSAATASAALMAQPSSTALEAQAGPTPLASRQWKLQAMRAQIVAARAERLATRAIPQRSATAHRWR